MEDHIYHTCKRKWEKKFLLVIMENLKLKWKWILKSFLYWTAYQLFSLRKKVLWWEEDAIAARQHRKSQVSALGPRCYPSVQHSRPLSLVENPFLSIMEERERLQCICYFMARHVNGKLQFLLRLHLSHSLFLDLLKKRKAFDGKNCAFVLLHIYSLFFFCKPLNGWPVKKVWNK